MLHFRKYPFSVQFFINKLLTSTLQYKRKNKHICGRSVLRSLNGKKTDYFSDNVGHIDGQLDNLPDLEGYILLKGVIIRFHFTYILSSILLII